MIPTQALFEAVSKLSQEITAELRITDIRVDFHSRKDSAYIDFINGHQTVLTRVIDARGDVYDFDDYDDVELFHKNNAV